MATSRSHRGMGRHERGLNILVMSGGFSKFLSASYVATELLSRAAGDELE